MTSIQIECFLAAARTGSMAKAARELFLSVQVVSQHIQKLEKELSAKVFFRNREGVSLTDAGRELLEFSSKWIGLYNGAMRSVQEEYSNLARRFRIGMSEYIDPMGQITGGIASFAEEHKTTDISGVQYSTQEIMQAVSRGEIDVALVCDTQITAGGDFEIVPFASEDLRLYVSHGPRLDPGLTVEDEAIRNVCRELPHLDTSYGPWNREEWQEISRRMSTYLGVSFQKNYTMPTFRAVVASANTLPCVVVCDARFGYLRENEHLQSFPLNVNSSICCISEKKNENPLIQEFQRHMKYYYG